MKKNITLFLLLTVLTFSGCSAPNVLSEKELANHYDRYLNGKISSIDNITLTYQNADTPLELRLTALEYMIRSNDPQAMQVLKNELQNAETMDPAILMKICDEVVLQKNSEWSQIMMIAYKKYIEQSFAIQDKMLTAIGATSSVRHLARYLEMYQFAHENLYKVDSYFSEYLGKFKDDAIVPILINIVNDPKRDIRLREQAIKILAEKNDPRIATVLTQLLGSPQSDLMIRDFAFNVMDHSTDEKLLLSLLDFMQRNKDRENKMMQTIISALGDYSNPAIIPSLQYIYKTITFPLELRQNALSGLLRFNTPAVLEELIRSTSETSQYYFWPEISKAVASNGNIELRQLMEELALSDQQKTLR